MNDSMDIDILQLLTTSSGINLLLTAFVPGFIFISLLRHWFNKLKNLKEIEMIFWSIPLSLSIIFLYYYAIFFIFGNFSIPNNLTPEIIFGRLGMYSSMTIFAVSFSIFFPQKYWRKKKKLDKINIKLTQFMFVLILISNYLIEFPTEIGAPRMQRGFIMPTANEWSIIIKGFGIAFIMAILIVFHKKFLPGHLKKK